METGYLGIKPPPRPAGAFCCMKNYTLGELASPEGARAFLDDCEKPENSVCQDIVANLKRAVEGGTNWHDGELADIVEKELQELMDERAKMIDIIERAESWGQFDGKLLEDMRAILDGTK